MENPKNQHHLAQKTQISSNVDHDQGKEFKAKSSFNAFSITKSTKSYPMIKESSLLKMKKMLIPIKDSKLESKAKQVIPKEGKKSSCKRKRRTRVEDLYVNDEDKVSVMERVDEVLESIGNDCTNKVFVKCMLPSNVSHGFWLYFPTDFCNKYLPNQDCTIVLIDESGKEYETKFIGNRKGLSAGWRGFSLAQRILKGDLLVFQLMRTEPYALKVHIVRVYSLQDVDAALCLTDIASGKKLMTKRKAKSLKPTVDMDRNALAQSLFKDGGRADEAKTDSDDLASEVLEGSEISDEFSSPENIFMERPSFELNY